MHYRIGWSATWRAMPTVHAKVTLTAQCSPQGFQGSCPPPPPCDKNRSQPSKRRKAPVACARYFAYSSFHLGTKSARIHCRAPLLEECPQHHGHKGDPGVTLGTCGAIGGKAQVILVWVRAPRRWERLPPTETRSHEGKA